MYDSSVCQSLTNLDYGLALQDKQNSVDLAPTASIKMGSEILEGLGKSMLYLPTLLLKISDFVKSSSYCGDLVACISLEERKFYWEILWINSLMRMEIPFDQVNGLSVEVREDDVVVVSIRVSHPPKFWSGWVIPHQPTQWSEADDFTNGYASKYCLHTLHFLKNAIMDPLEKVFNQEPRLKVLATGGLLGVKEHEMFESYSHFPST